MRRLDFGACRCPRRCCRAMLSCAPEGFHTDPTCCVTIDTGFGSSCFAHSQTRSSPAPSPIFRVLGSGPQSCASTSPPLPADSEKVVSTRHVRAIRPCSRRCLRTAGVPARLGTSVEPRRSTTQLGTAMSSAARCSVRRASKWMIELTTVRRLSTGRLRESPHGATLETVLTTALRGMALGTAHANGGTALVHMVSGPAAT